MKYKDYYKILGLAGPKATDEEIRSAFRTLAKKYHPDMNPGNLIAAENFKNVNEAYQVLTNEDEKRKFNMKYYAHSFKRTFSMNTIKEKIDTSGSSEFIEMFIGKQETNKKQSSKSKTTGENIETSIDITLEEAFNGVSKRIQFKDYNNKPKTITIKVPTGIVNGGVIRIKEQGKLSKNGGKAGDLLIKINILEHPKFRLQKENLLMDLPILPSEAVLGCKIKVTGIDNSTNDVLIEAGTNSGKEIIIKNAGYYNEKGERGDIILKTKIVVPNEISAEERKLYEKLQKITEFVPRNY